MYLYNMIFLLWDVAKAVSTKSIVLINCRKKKSSAKSTFILCNWLNESVLKSLKPKWSGPKSEKNCPGRNFVFCFWPDQARTEISISFTGQAEPGPKFLLRAGLGQDCSRAGRAWKIRPLQTSNLHTSHLEDYGNLRIPPSQYKERP